MQVSLGSYLWNVKLRAAGLKGEALGRAGREQPGSLVRRLHVMLVPPGCDAESLGGDVGSSADCSCDAPWCFTSVLNTGVAFQITSQT